jgi:uncharacterized protein YcfJ
MNQITVDSWRQCALCAALALVATACGKQSPAPPASSNAPAQSAAPAAMPAAQQQNVSVAELLSGSDAQPMASEPASNAQTSPPPTGAGAGIVPDPGDAEYARVVSVAPATGPHRVCTDETVTEKRKPDDQHQVAGTVIGAIAGGVIGHQIGGGRGRTLATVGGAVGGGVVGKQVQKNQQSKDTVTRVVKHCRMVDESTANASVYDVVYAYQGQNFHVHLDHDPGDRLALPVRGVVNE